MEFRGLETFLMLAECGSFAEAARRLFISQPTVTTRIQALEEELGVPLFRRDVKGCSPTAAGLVLERHARRILQARQECLEEFQDVRQRRTGSFRVGATALGTYILPEAARHWESQCPDQKLFFSISNTGKVLKELEHGQVDAALVPLWEREPGSQFALWPVGQDALVLVCGAGNSLAACSQVRPEDLRGQRFLLREQGSQTRTLFEQWLRDHGLDLRDAAEVGQSEGIRRTVSQNAGISLLSLRSLVGDHSVTPLPVEGFPILREYCVVCLRSQRERREVRIFADLVRGLWAQATGDSPAAAEESGVPSLC